MENNEFILIVGAMTSGKSKFLIDNYYGKEDVEAFSPTIDTRDAVITSRAYSDKHIPCTKITQPSEMLKSNKRTIIPITRRMCFEAPAELPSLLIDRDI